MEENGIMLLNEKDIKESDKNMNENEFVEAIEAEKEEVL